MDLPIADQLECLEQEHDDLQRRYEDTLKELERVSRENEALQSRLATIEGLWQTYTSHKACETNSKSRAAAIWSKLDFAIRD